MYKHAKQICSKGKLKNAAFSPNPRFLFYDQLLLSPSKSVVLCGLDDLNAHIITNRINDLLKSNVKSIP